MTLLNYPRTFAHSEPLNEIFKQASNIAFLNIQQQVRHCLESPCGILIFGAGANGKRVARELILSGYCVLGFLDETPEKIGTIINELTVFSLETAKQTLKGNLLVVISIFNPYHSFLETQDRLREYGWKSISFFNTAILFHENLLPFYFFDHPQQVIKVANSYSYLFKLLIDQRSRDELISHIRFRLYLDFDCLLKPVGPDFSYLKDFLIPNKVSFVDGGAFDGDTIRAFLNLVGDNFSQIFAFEPDPINFKRLNDYYNLLPSTFKNRITLESAGLWSKKGKLGFNSTATTGSSLSLNPSDTQINVIALDEYIPSNTPLILKLDVEGAEYEAIQGAKNIIYEGQAIILIATYHKPEDLWSLPKLILSINPRYRFGLRSHGYDGADLMLYAIPEILL